MLCSGAEVVVLLLSLSLLPICYWISRLFSAEGKDPLREGVLGGDIIPETEKQEGMAPKERWRDWPPLLKSAHLD